MPTSAHDSDAMRAVRDRLVELTQELVLFPSTASRREDRDRCRDFIRFHIGSLDGVEAVDVESGEYPSLLVLPEGSREPDVLLCAHLDVVEHERVEDYRPRVHGDRIEGPGAGDMKGPLAICVEIFRSLHVRHPGVSLGLAVTSDEEIGGHHGVGHLFGEYGLRCGLALIPDGGTLDEITVEEKGILQLDLVAERTSRSAHASRPWLSDNPTDPLLDALARLRSRFADLAHEEDRWYPTCAITILDTANRTVNRIPRTARAVVDVRFPPPWTSEELTTLVREVAGDDVSVTTRMSAEPTHLSPDPEFVRIAEDEIGREVRLVRESGGSDARFICVHGTPVIMSRPVMGNIHSVDEWIDIPSMLTFYRIYERYLTRRLVGSI